MAEPLRCPGQDARALTVSMHKCPECGYAVELFSDEMRRRCPKCGATVMRQETPTCVAWCASARQCLGEERWAEAMAAAGTLPDRKPEE